MWTFRASVSKSWCYRARRLEVEELRTNTRRPVGECVVHHFFPRNDLRSSLHVHSKNCHMSSLLGGLPVLGRDVDSPSPGTRR